jgi:hypothetical protein
MNSKKKPNISTKLPLEKFEELKQNIREFWGIDVNSDDDVINFAIDYYGGGVLSSRAIAKFFAHYKLFLKAKKEFGKDVYFSPSDKEWLKVGRKIRKNL